MRKKIVFTEKEIHGKLHKFFDHVGGNKKSIGVWVQPLFKKHKEHQKDYDAGIKKVIRNSKFPTIALVEKKRMKKVKEWIERTHEESPLKKPILLLNAEMTGPETDMNVKPSIGFDGLARLLSGEAKNIYVFGEMGDFTQIYDIKQGERAKDPTLNHQLKGSRKELLTGFCVHNVYKNLYARAEAHDFKVHYLLKHILRKQPVHK
ncbi:hypothetical protein K8R43_01240 [archaeon]|nr:hypothetical protein [archaeon]